MNKTKKSEWKIEEWYGYKPQTSLWDDFCSIESEGAEAVENLISNLVLDNPTDIVLLTELCMVLDWRHWEHFEKNFKLSRTYWFSLRNLKAYIETNFKGEELKYYFRKRR